MRLEEKCPCGGSLEVVYMHGGLTTSRADQERETGEARKQIDVFRRAHKPCLKRLAEAAPEKTDAD